MANDLSISLIPLALRRMKGVKTVASGAVNRTIPQDEARSESASSRKRGYIQPFALENPLGASAVQATV